MPDWKDKVVLITGGSAGLGRAIANAFATAGGRVVLAARDTQRLEDAVRSLRERGLEATGVPADITRDEDVNQLVARTIETYGQLDVLVNNAGRSDRGTALDTSVDEFRQLLELNFLALVRCAQAAAAHLVESRGHLVNIGSLSAKTATVHLGAYPASKFPVAAYSQQLRYELGPQGVHVLLVCPGPIAREDAGTRYDAQTSDLPENARQPGGGVRLKGISPARIAERILACCEKRKAELVMPGRARLLFACAQLSPGLGDWLLRRFT